MYFEPHKLYRIVTPPTEMDENGDPIGEQPAAIREYLCDCFLHDVKTEEKKGYTGIGIDVSYRVNMDRRGDLKTGMEVEVTEADGVTVRGAGTIADVKSTGGMSFAGGPEYTTIYL
jgi:hypothetical protein